MCLKVVQQGLLKEEMEEHSLTESGELFQEEGTNSDTWYGKFLCTKILDTRWKVHMITNYIVHCS